MVVEVSPRCGPGPMKKLSFTGTMLTNVFAVIGMIATYVVVITVLNALFWRTVRRRESRLIAQQREKALAEYEKLMRQREKSWLN